MKIKLHLEETLHCPFCNKPIYHFTPEYREWKFYCKHCELAIVPVEHITKPKGSGIIGIIVAIPLKIEFKEVI